MTRPGRAADPGAGQAGEPCRGCGAPLAADQRYCLNCGERRGGPRVDFRQPPRRRRAGAGTARRRAARRPARPAAGRRSGEQPERDYTPLAAVGGIAVLGLMLLVGVLIGKETAGDEQHRPAPVIAAGAEAEAARAKQRRTRRAEGEGAARRRRPPARSRRRRPKTRAADQQAASGSGPVEASDNALEELQNRARRTTRKKAPSCRTKSRPPGEPPPDRQQGARAAAAEGTAIE